MPTGVLAGKEAEIAALRATKKTFRDIADHFQVDEKLVRMHWKRWRHLVESTDKPPE